MYRSGRPIREASLPKSSIEDVHALMADGWKKFTAAETTEGDGSLSTEAWVHYLSGITTAASKGKSGTVHAEMDALDRCLKELGLLDPDSLTIWRDSTPYVHLIGTVGCYSKPCCCHCAAALGLLYVRPAIEVGVGKTNKSKKPTGIESQRVPTTSVLKLIMSIYDIKMPLDDFKRAWWSWKGIT